MTKAEWATSREPQRMLSAARSLLTERRAVLIAVACCRRLHSLLTSDAGERLTALERAADRGMPVGGWTELSNDAMAEADGLSYRMDTPAGCARWLAANAVWMACDKKPAAALDEAAAAAEVSRQDPAAFDIARPGPRLAGEPSEQAAQAALVRCIVPFPSQPSRPLLAAPTGDVAAIARTIYDDRRFDELPVLADALEEAGCADAALLMHLRSPGPHVRGCWVLDLVLGRS